MTDEVQTVEFQVAGDRQVDPAEWAATAAHVRESLAADGLPASDMTEAMNGFRFLDESRAHWMYDGSQWLRWDGQAWAGQAPPAALRLQPFTLDWLPDPTEDPPAGIEPAEVSDAAEAAQPGPAEPAEAAPVSAPSPAPAIAAPYRATHRVPAGGMPAWPNPDPSMAPPFRLDPWLDVMVVEFSPTGWARIRASNGWIGWVDGRLLILG